MFGFTAELPINLSNKPQATYNYDNYISELRFRLQHTHQIARQNLTDRMHNNKKYYDQGVNMPDFKEGDQVLLLKHKRDNKYDCPYDEGWVIHRMLTPVTADIIKNGHRRRAHVDSLIQANDEAARRHCETTLPTQSKRRNGTSLATIHVNLLLTLAFSNDYSFIFLD